MEAKTISSKEDLLSAIYRKNTSNPSSNLTIQIMDGAEILAKKAMKFWQNKITLHEEGVHRTLIELGVATDISDAMGKASKYLSDLYVGSLKHFSLEVKRVGTFGYHFKRAYF